MVFSKLRTANVALSPHEVRGVAAVGVGEGVNAIDQLRDTECPQSVPPRSRRASAAGAAIKKSSATV